MIPMARAKSTSNPQLPGGTAFCDTNRYNAATFSMLAAASSLPHRFSLQDTPLISTANITMQFGAKPLFENISVKFGNGNRYGNGRFHSSHRYIFPKQPAVADPSAHKHRHTDRNGRCRSNTYTAPHTRADSANC